VKVEGHTGFDQGVSGMRGRKPGASVAPEKHEMANTRHPQGEDSGVWDAEGVYEEE